MTWRVAARNELHAYYAEEFPSRVDSLPAFITAHGPKQYALAFDEPHPVRGDAPDRNFIRRDTWQTNRNDERVRPNFDEFDDLVQFIRYPARHDPLTGTDATLADPDLLKKGDPYPEAVYYALDHWERPWVLLVDIDAKDIARQRANESVSGHHDLPEVELLADADVTAAPPKGYPYAFADIERALEYGFEVAEIFENDFKAEETMVVYSGQGVHVYLLDTDRQHRYDAKSREVLNDLLLEHYEIPIDPVVTADRKRVARLPYSLHAEICRVVQPVEEPDFDFRTEAQPAFLAEGT